MNISTLFIDLDGTLYSNGNGIWEAIAIRMETYMLQILQLPEEKIPSLRQEYFQEYGTTLKGLQANYPIDEYDYLKFVHDIPIEQFLKPDKRLRNILENIPLPKWIFTNADRAHSERVLNALDINGYFSGIIDIVSMEFSNKPEPISYHRALELAGNPSPQECLFFDDSPKNLLFAKEIGMITVLVGNKPFSPEIDYHIPNIYGIKEILAQLN